jgi:ABC-type branched-subunit amino acid transport system ATPase component
MLRVENINTFYGRTQILQNVSLFIEDGEVVSLMGRQGSGKTTALKAIMGIIPISPGKVEFRGMDISGQPPFRIFRLGIGYVPQNKQIFPDLTVEQNLRVVRSQRRATDVGDRTRPPR